MPKSLLAAGGRASVGLLGSQASSTIVKHLPSVLKWPCSPTKTPQSVRERLLGRNPLDGNRPGVSPHTIRVSPEGLFAVDSTSINIVKITPAIAVQLVVGSFQGYSGHVDRKPGDARFSGPRGVAMDGKGNGYFADTGNLAVRKIGEAGVTTIAGGKSSVACIKMCLVRM